MIHIQKPDGTVLTWAEKCDIFIRWKMRHLMVERDKAILGFPSIFDDFETIHAGTVSYQYLGYDSLLLIPRDLRIEQKKHYYWDYAGDVLKDANSGLWDYAEGKDL